MLLTTVPEPSVAGTLPGSRNVRQIGHVGAYRFGVHSAHLTKLRALYAGGTPTHRIPLGGMGSFRNKCRDCSPAPAGKTGSPVGTCLSRGQQHLALRDGLTTTAIRRPQPAGPECRTGWAPARRR